MKLDNGLAEAMFYGMKTYKSIATMEKIFVLWMKDGIRFVTSENLYPLQK
jgi:hypothetical protein